MIGKLLILAVVVLGYFWLKSWYKSLDKQARKKAMWNIAVIGLVVILVAAVATGRMHWAGLAFAGVLGFLKVIATYGMRFAPLLFSLARKQNFATPEFCTPYLNVKLQFGNQVNLEGSVIDGPHAGKNLNELGNDDLVELANFYKEKCKRSYYLILVLLQKSGSNQYHQQQQGVEDNTSITRQEAIQVLGLADEFTDEDVKLAHRKLIQKLHPDKGGNAWLASRINLAKETLLKKS